MTDLSSVLPAWVPWAGPLLALATVSTVSLVLVRVLIVGSLRTAERAEHWTERARHVHVARAGAALLLLVLPPLGGIAAVSFVGPLSAVSRSVVIWALAVLGALVALRQSAKVDRFVHGRSERGLLESAFATVISFVPILILITLGFVAPAEVSEWAMLPWLVVVVVAVYGWLHAALVIAHTPLARLADARTSSVVARASESLSVDVDRVIEFRTRQPNAYAFPWLGVLAFTTGLLDALDDEELEAITHHELAHLAETSGLTRLRQAHLYALIPIVAVRPLYGSFGFLGPLAAVLFFVAVTEVVRRRAVVAEHASDSAAVDSIHRSEAYAQALEKTYRIGLIPAVLRRSTHGQLHERLEIAGIVPEFEPPAPPPRSRGVAALLAAIGVLSVAWLSPWLAYFATSDDSLFPTHLSATLPAYGSAGLEWLASEAELDESWRDAAVLYDAAADTRPANGFLRLGAVRSWSYAGDCSRAERAADQLHPDSPIEDLRYAAELVEWCDLTGGLPPG